MGVNETLRRKRKRIHDDHYYLLARYPGISGFRDWTTTEEVVVTGRKARLHRCHMAREYLANGRRHFRLHDGHLPAYMPIVAEVDALRWLDANPFGEIAEVLDTTP